MTRPGQFGQYGGIYVPDTLYQTLLDLDAQYRIIRKDSAFKKELQYYLREFVGRPTPLTFLHNLSKKLGCSVYLKREDLNHTGAHKINNTIGQALLARRLEKKRLIAETGAGQHGVASATAASLFGLECTIFMGKKDMERQALNVYRMRLLGAEVVSVTSGSQTLKDATTEAIRDWLSTSDTSHFMIGSATGPHPYPTIVRDFQSVIGRETRAQIIKKEGRLPDVIIACVGGGSNSIGMFTPFVKDKAVRLIAVEAGGHGINTASHAATLSKGKPGVLHGTYSYLLQDKHGQIQEAHSISAGLDYPGVGPELSFLKDQGRIEVGAVTDTQAIAACKWLSANEGIIPALESSHALAYLKEMKGIPKGALVVLCLSGRGDKDMETLRRYDDTAH